MRDRRDIHTHAGAIALSVADAADAARCSRASCPEASADRTVGEAPNAPISQAVRVGPPAGFIKVWCSARQLRASEVDACCLKHPGWG
jgi:hypothetical protein